MGFGAPAAIGARASNPSKPVIAVVGDGSFIMTCQEIASAVEEKFPIVVLVMNDYCLGMIKQLQDSFYGKRHESCGLGRSVDYAKLAESMGGVGIRVPEESQIEPAIRAGLDEERITVIDCILEDTSHIYPMVTGKSLSEYQE